MSRPPLILKDSDDSLAERPGGVFPPRFTTRVTERMTKIANFRGYTVRVWETVDALALGPNHAINRALRELELVAAEGAIITPAEMGAAIESVPNVAAYEILDPQGNGVVVYPEWP